MIVEAGGTTRIKRYLGDYAIQDLYPSSGGKNLLYTHKDHIGSLHVVTQVRSFGGIEVMQEVSFDGWGARRSPSDWISPPAGIAALRAITPRGFTGHEHVDHAGIVHMNGRIYDPVLGRFLQADPVVQAPDNSQNLNRYTYVLNNPLSYTDPSGFFFKSIGNFIGKFWQPILAIGITVVSAGVATGALFASLEIAGTSAAWGVAIGGGALAGLVNAGNLRGALYGAFSAAAFHGVGTYFSNIRGAAAKNLGRFGNFVKDNLRLTKTIAHGLTGGIMNELQGGKFAHGFLSAGATQAFAPEIDGIGIGDGALSFGDRALRVASAAALGGAVSEVTGGKFANGAVTAAMAFSFGRLANETEEQRLEREGRPLTADEREIFADHFPEETLDSARIIDGRVPWWLRKDMAAITLGNRIHFRDGVYVPGTASGVEILGHELVHVQQFAEGMTILSYLFESRRGYFNNRFEIEAYSRDTQIRDSFCQSNPQAEGC